MLRNILNRTVGCGQRVSKFNGSEQRSIHWEARDADQSVKKKTAANRALFVPDNSKRVLG